MKVTILSKTDKTFTTFLLFLIAVGYFSGKFNSFELFVLVFMQMAYIEIIMIRKNLIIQAKR